MAQAFVGVWFTRCEEGLCINCTPAEREACEEGFVKSLLEDEGFVSKQEVGIAY